MDKKICAVVQDLLVLYEDDVLKEESKKMVEEHIRTCEECRRIYEHAKELPDIEDIKEKSEEEQEAEAIKIMKRASKPGVSFKKACIVALVLFVAVILDIIFGYLTDTHGVIDYLRKVPASSLQVEELYQLSNGDIYCTLKSSEKLTESSITEIKHLIERNTEDADLTYAQRISYTRNFIWGALGYREVTFVFSTEETEISSKTGKEYLYRCPRIEVIGKNDKDKLTIWKKGQDTRKAPEEIERKAVIEYLKNGKLQKAFTLSQKAGIDVEECIAELEKTNAVDEFECFAEAVDEMEGFEEGDYYEIWGTENTDLVMNYKLSEE